MRKTLAERLDSKLDKSPRRNGCWVWTASTIDGYGQIGIVRDGKSTNNRAHRIAFELATGTAPGELCVLHRCDNPPCCNPRHLFLGDRNDNAQDKMAKGRHNYKTHRGSKHGMAKVNDEIVVQMRELYAAKKMTQTGLAERFGLSQATVWAILHRKTWTHVS